jgi:uncharacterized membrane protein YgcG
MAGEGPVSLNETLAAAGAALASALPLGAARALKAGAPVVLHRRTRRVAWPPPLHNDDAAASFGEASGSGHRSEIYPGSGAWSEWSGDRGGNDVDLYAGDPALAAALARRRFQTASAALALQLSPPAQAAECMPLAATETFSANPAARASQAPPPLSAGAESPRPPLADDATAAAAASAAVAAAAAAASASRRGAWAAQADVVRAELQRAAAAFHRRERDADEAARAAAALRAQAAVADLLAATSGASLGATPWATPGAAGATVKAAVLRAASTVAGSLKDPSKLEAEAAREQLPPPLLNSPRDGVPPLLAKYRKFLANRAAEKQPGTRWCPSPGCETALRPDQHAKKNKKTKPRTTLGAGAAAEGAAAAAYGASRRRAAMQQQLLLPLQRLTLVAKAFLWRSSAPCVDPAAAAARATAAASPLDAPRDRQRSGRSSSGSSDDSSSGSGRWGSSGGGDCGRVACCAARCGLAAVGGSLKLVAAFAAAAVGADLVASRALPAPVLTCPSCELDVCGRCGRPAHRWRTQPQPQAAAATARAGSSSSSDASSSTGSSSTGSRSRWFQGRWSSGGGCEEAVDDTLAAYRKEKHLQPCPACCRQVEKVDACPHMSCPCGHQWCWVCRGNFPCANLHFGKSGYGSSEEIGDVTGVGRVAKTNAAAGAACAGKQYLCVFVFALACPVFRLSCLLHRVFRMSLLFLCVFSRRCSASPCSPGWRPSALARPWRPSSLPSRRSPGLRPAWAAR